MIPTAMSGAERQLRYLDRLLKRGTSATESDHALIQQQLTTTQLELEKARTRIAELEKALAARDKARDRFEKLYEKIKRPPPFEPSAE